MVENTIEGELYVTSRTAYDDKMLEKLAKLVAKGRGEVGDEPVMGRRKKGAMRRSEREQNARKLGIHRRG